MGELSGGSAVSAGLVGKLAASAAAVHELAEIEMQAQNNYLLMVATSQIRGGC